MIVGSLEINLMADVARLTRDMSAGRQIVSNAAAGMERAANAARNALAAIGAGIGLQQLGQMVDQYVKFTSQLKLATQSQREYNTAYADVKRIAAGSTQGLQETGVLYARVANGTRELGISQKQLANVVETVNLSLLVSGATASEAASAQLQLSQAFASGTLRGEEFNSVNEAAPRLMKALADGIGVPVGALKKMAEEGLITSEIMANVLPNALTALREEAKNIQTISGSFTLLKNNAIEFVGSTAQASGAVSSISTVLSGLANNLNIVAGALLTVVAVRIANFFDAAITRTRAAVLANNALIASNLATAKSEFDAANAADRLAGARLNEVRAATLAASGNVQLALTMNGLIPAQNRAAVTSLALSSSYFGLAGAQAAATLGARALNAALAFTGGPLGLIITLLGVAATAWGFYEYSQTKANEKAAADTKASAGEITENLSKVNAMLRERIALQNAGASGAVTGEGTGSQELRDTLRDINELKAKGASLDASDQIRLISLQGIYNALNKEIQDNVDLKRESEANGQIAKDVVAVRERLNGVNQQYIKDLGVLKSALDKGAVSQEEYTQLVTKLASETYKASDAYKASEKRSKEAATASKQQAEAYRDLISSLQDRVDMTAREVAGLRPLNEAEKAHIALTRQVAEGKLNLTKVQEGNARSLIDEARANDVLTKSNAEWAALQQQLAENARQADEASSTEDSRVLLDINARIAATKQEIDLYGAGAAAVTAAEATKVRAMAGSMAITEQYREQLLLQADALDRLGEMQGVKSDLDALFDTGRVETFSEALRNAFGEAGSSMAQLGGALQEYVSKQANAEKDIAAVKLKYGKDDVRATRDIAKIQERMEADRIGAYGDIAGAAKGFFKQNSTGYKLMEGAEQAFRAIQLANQMQSLYTHLFVTTAKATGTTAGQAVETTAVIGGEAARNAAKVPGVFMSFMSAMGPWGMAAAGVAIAAVLGGGFGGGGGVDLTAQRQELQGTGSVLGSDDKSESIAHALDAIEGVSVQGLAISNGMLASLRNIEAGITQFASLLVRTTGVTGKFGAGIDNRGSADALGSSAMGILATGGLIGIALDKITGGWVGKITGSVLGKIFGGKTTVEDTGFTAGKTNFASIAAGGLNAMQFADIKKEGGWFSKDKTSVQTQSLGEEGNRQIASVLMSLYDTVLQAGTMLGLGADGFAAQLNSFVVDIGKISLKGLSDDEIEKELSAVFSKVGDDLAAFGVAGLGQFQKVGEGYLETLTRVATNYRAVTVVIDSMGMTFGAVGLASVGARERLIDLVGGLDEFTSSADQFLADFYTDKERADSLRTRITPTLDQYGIKTGAEDSLQQFRSVVTGLDLTTEAGARAYATLMQIAPAFKQIADVDKEALEKALDLSNSKRELEIQIMEMLGDKAGALAATRALELRDLDASLGPLQERVYALEDEATALQTANSLLSIQAQIYELTGDKAGAAAVLAQQHVNALAALDPALRGATQNLWDLQTAAKAADQVKAGAAALMSGVDGAFSALQKVVAREKKALQEDIDVRTKSVQKIESLSQALRGSLDSMSVTGFEAQDRQAAQAQIQTALAIAKASGVLPSADDLKSALSVLGKDSSNQFATQADYLRDFYATKNGITDLANITDKSLSAEERSLKALEDQVTQYDRMLEREQEQIDIAKGQSTVDLSVEQTLQAVLGALLAANANPINAASTAINGAYQSALGRAPDAAGLAYYQDRAAAGASIGDIVGSVNGSPEAQIQKLYKDVLGRTADAGGTQYWLKQLGAGQSVGDIRAAMLSSDEAKKAKSVPGYAAGGDHGGGWRIVGENGPELEATGPARIFNASQTQGMMRRLASPQESSAVLAAAVDRLSATVEQQAGVIERQGVALEQIQRNTRRGADTLDVVTEGGKAMRTKEQAA